MQNESQNASDTQFQLFEESFHSLKELCHEQAVTDKDPEDKVFLETMERVLDGLESAFRHHFEGRTGHIVSPKSEEPWD